MSLPGPRSPLALLRFLRDLDVDAHATLDHLHARYGAVVGVGRWPLQVVLLLGRDGNELVLSRQPDAFEWRRAMRPLIPVDGDTALVVTDGPEHDRRRRLVQPAFHKRRIDGYLDLMTGEADAAIDQLTPGSVADIHAVFRAAIRRTVVLALFGTHLQGRADEIGDLLQPAFDFLNLPPLRQQLKLPFPGTAYRAARQARRAVDRVVDEEVARRAAERSEGGDDVLAMLLAPGDGDDGRLGPQEIRDQVVSLIAAGYDTTSAAMAWTVHRAARTPGVWDRLRAELAAEVGDRPLAVEDVRRLPYLAGVVQESLRLDPPGVVAPRSTVRPVEVDGHRIGRRTLVFYSAYATGRDPACWPDPDVFKPERWDTAAPGYEAPPRHAFVPFGGGARRCLGFAFATLELQAMLARLVQRVDLELVDPTPPQPRGIATSAPSGGVPVRVLDRR